MMLTADGLTATWSTCIPCTNFALFRVLLAYEMQDNVDFSAMLASYVSNPSADTFVNIHEDFYQAYKTDEYSIVYSDLSFFDTSPMLSFIDSYKVIKDNIAQTAIKKSIAVTPFAQDDFPSEYLQCRNRRRHNIRTVPRPRRNGQDHILQACLSGNQLADFGNRQRCTENLDEFVLGKFIRARRPNYI